MYSRSVTAQMIEATNRRMEIRAQQTGGQFFPLDYHSQSQIDKAIAHFEDLIDPDSGQMKRALRPDEQAWIQNERKLCALDFRYWCNPPEAPIWMADFSFKPIGEIKIGDRVIGWHKPEREKLKAQWWRNHYVASTVVSVKRRIAPLIEVTMESGRIVRCTPDHLWANGGSSRNHSVRSDNRKSYAYPWTKARVGAKLRYAVEPVERLSPEDERLAAWLGGIFDGEGSCSISGIQIAQSQSHNPEVVDEIARVLTKLGFEFRYDNGKAFRLVGGMRARAKFAATCRPIRISKIKPTILGQVECVSDTIVSVKYLGEGEVVSLQTTTGNYVAWGYLSKNCSHYATIVNWEKKPIHPTLNVAQNIVVDLWAEHEERAIAIILMHLKARQLGITTVYELADCHRFQFWPNSNVIIASADPKKTVEMGQMIRFCLEQQPWWLIPSDPRDKTEKNMTVEFAALNTRLSIQAGNQFHGVARGGTPNVGHLTEVSSWDNAEEDIDASFIRAIHETPDVFVGLESTGKGQDGWFPDTWNVVKEDWPRGRSRIRGEFLPWFVGTDIYPPAADLRARPIPPGWTPADRTINHAERARQYVLSNPMLMKHLAKGDTGWKMPLAQMWYYEIERDTALRKKTLNKFLEEMPADDHEAFQNTGISVIDQDIVLSYREKVQVPLGVYAIVGPGIHPSLVPPRNQWLTGPGAPPVINVNVSGACRSTEVYQFIPLKFGGYPGYDPMFKLFIFEWPEANEIYGIGVDTSDGIGQDWSVLEGLRIGTPDRPHGQTFEYASPYIKADQLWPIALAMGAFYSVHQQAQNRRVQCRICVECRGNGEIVQHELKKRGWVNFHPWKKYDNRRRVPDGKVHKEGVFTNVWFRSMMMDKLLTVIDEEALDIGSPWLVKELGSLERDPDERSARAAYNTHDDRVIAICFPLFSLTVDLRPRQLFRRSTTPEYLPQAADETTVVSTNYAVWQPSNQGSSTYINPSQGLERNARGALTLGQVRPRSGGGW